MSHIPQTKPNLHYQATLFLVPCRVCLNIGIPNAHHWVSNCPFKRQTLNPSLLTQNTNIRTQVPDQAGNNSPTMLVVVTYGISLCPGT